MSSTCCKQLKCRPWVKPTSPYCAITDIPTSRRKPSEAVGWYPGSPNHAPVGTLPSAPTQCWVIAVPRSHGPLLLVIHAQTLLSLQVSVVHVVLGLVRISDVQLRRVSCIWWVSSLPPLTLLCNIRGAIGSYLEVYLAHLNNFGIV